MLKLHLYRMYIQCILQTSVLNHRMEIFRQGQPLSVEGWLGLAKRYLTSLDNSMATLLHFAWREKLQVLNDDLQVHVLYENLHIIQQH